MYTQLAVPDQLAKQQKQLTELTTCPSASCDVRPEVSFLVSVRVEKYMFFKTPM